MVAGFLRPLAGRPFACHCKEGGIFRSKGWRSQVYFGHASAEGFDFVKEGEGGVD